MARPSSTPKRERVKKKLIKKRKRDLSLMHAARLLIQTYNPDIYYQKISRRGYDLWSTQAYVYERTDDRLIAEPFSRGI